MDMEKASLVHEFSFSDIQAFHKEVQKLCGQRRSLYIYFTCNDDSNGRPWCPDCGLANPVVLKLVQEQSHTSLLVCRVGDRPAWKNAEHPLRTDPHLKLTGIPTLLKCNMETGEPIPGKRLGFELEQCKTGSEVENLVQGLIA
mmetsp:Transcript_27925/g.53144  ORF Transcript_27925/g.53144 Transcript_27925/m.53144 type:complete len:143 (+) Transcript_27925:127-555(+)